MFSDKTIERLIIYKFLLEKYKANNIKNVFSHQIAEMAGSTPSQVRRDLMSVGYTGNQKNGYNIKELNISIEKFLHPAQNINIILVGVGNLGKAILNYFSDLSSKYKIAASFDVDKNIIGEYIFCSKCYSIDDLDKIVIENNVKTGFITVPLSSAQEVADKLVSAGIKGIINFAPVRIKVPENVYVENIDFSITVEKVNFFAFKNI